MNNGVLLAHKEIPITLENCLISYLKSKSPQSLALIPDFVNASKNLFREEEINQLNTFVKQNRGELFFAKSWLMAEGQSETVILPYFAKILESRKMSPEEIPENIRYLIERLCKK